MFLSPLPCAGYHPVLTGLFPKPPNSFPCLSSLHTSILLPLLKTLQRLPNLPWINVKFYHSLNDCPWPAPSSAVPWFLLPLVQWTHSHQLLCTPHNARKLLSWDLGSYESLHLPHTLLISYQWSRFFLSKITYPIVLCFVFPLEFIIIWHIRHFLSVSPH